MYFKYHKKQLTPYEYIEFDEASMNWKKICLYKNQKLIKTIDLDKITFFYISEKDPRH